MNNPRNEMSSYTLVLFMTTKNHDNSDRAYLVGNTGERDDAVWLPASQVNVEALNRGREPETISGLATNRTNPIASFSIPAWLAEERGLV